MSHFGLLVLGPDPEGQLVKFREYQGDLQQHPNIQAMDVTEQLRKEHSEVVIEMLSLPESYDLRQVNWNVWKHPVFGRVVFRDDERMWAANPNYDAKEGPWKPGNDKLIQAYPEGAVEVKVKAVDTFTFEEYMMYIECGDYPGLHIDDLKNYPNGLHPDFPRGYTLTDDECKIIRVCRVTNPEGYWDYYEVGGRWRSSLKIKSNVHLLSMDCTPNVDQLLLGSPQPMALIGDAKARTKPGWADLALKRDIDLDGMYAEGAAEAGELFDRFTALIQGHPWPHTWRELHTRWSKRNEKPEPGAVYQPLYLTSESGALREVSTLEDYRQFYSSQPAVKAFESNEELKRMFLMECPFHYFGQDRAAFVHMRGLSERSAHCYSVLANGQWASKGRMLMFGCSEDQYTDLEWVEKVQQLIDGVPDDTLFTVVDCHI